MKKYQNIFSFSNPATRCTSLHTPNRLLQNTFSFANFDNGCSSTPWNYFSFPFYYFLPPGVQASIHLIGCHRILLFLPFLFSFANSDNGCSSTHSDFRFFSLLFLFKILPLGVHASINLIACQEKWNLGKRFFVVVFCFYCSLGEEIGWKGIFSCLFSYLPSFS